MLASSLLSLEARHLSWELESRLERIRLAPFPPEAELPEAAAKQRDRISAFTARKRT
ncbi:MAG: hypothetical protein Kow001_12960 [Acidobacteriota bacterium]